MVAKKYQGQIQVIKHNHSASEQAFNSMILALDYYKRQDTPNLLIFAGDEVLGNEEINAKLDTTVAQLLQAGKRDPGFRTVWCCY